MSMTIEQSEISCLMAELRLARYEVNRLHNVMHDLPEGWHVFTDDGEWTTCRSQKEAEAYAKECSVEGLLAAVVNIVAKVQPEQVEDMAAYNGLTPGVDFPGTLNQPRAA